MIRSTCICHKNRKFRFKEIIRYKNETVFPQYEGIIIGRCSSCGILKTFPPAKSALFNPGQSRGTMYDKQSEKFTNIFLPIVNKIKHFKPKGKILDVGCATGLLLSLLKKEGYEIAGIEPNRQAFIKTQKKIGKIIFNGTLKKYSKIHKGKFDCIIYNHVLEHVENVVEELQLAKKLLRKNGIIVIGLPNINNVIFFLRQKYWEPLMPNEHVWHFGTSQIKTLLQKLNLKILDVSFSDDQRSDYPQIKRIYFKFLSVINKILGTGESQLLVVAN